MCAPAAKSAANDTGHKGPIHRPIRAPKTQIKEGNNYKTTLLQKIYHDKHHYIPGTSVSKKSKRMSSSNYLCVSRLDGLTATYPSKHEDPNHNYIIPRKLDPEQKLSANNQWILCL
jgi:hypothetical protein